MCQNCFKSSYLNSVTKAIFVQCREYKWNNKKMWFLEFICLIFLLNAVLANNMSGSSNRRDRKRENVTVELYIICINIVPKSSLLLSVSLSCSFCLFSYLPFKRTFYVTTGTIISRRERNGKERYIRLVKERLMLYSIRILFLFAPRRVCRGSRMSGRVRKLHITMSYYGSLYYYLVMEW